MVTEKSKRLAVELVNIIKSLSGQGYLDPLVVDILTDMSRQARVVKEKLTEE